MSGAKAIAGPAVAEAGQMSVLFAESLAEHIKKAAIEHELAAWYYLDGRYKLTEKLTKQESDPNDPHLGALEQVGRNLRDRLQDYSGTEYAALALEIGKVLDTIASRGSLNHV